MKLEPDQEKLLAAIRKVWESMPSLRFLQLIGNVLGRASPEDIYFIDDDDFQAGLLHTYQYIFGDKCQFCLGAKGGIPGNENIVGGVTVCDYCDTLLSDITANKFQKTP